MSDTPVTREDDLFLAAIEIDDPQRRRRFLDRACRNDAELRHRMDDLLQHHADAGSFLETPAGKSHPTVLGGESLLGRWEDREERSIEEELSFLEPSDVPGVLGRLSKYEVLSVVGRGGLGIVLKARDPELDRIVAIKVPVSELATNPLARRRFRREAQAAAAVGHDHVVTIHAVGEERGLPYLVMEYVAGRSLQERINAEGPLELKEILRIGMQTARGLAAAHAQGLVHRDVKPANILLENGIERVKLTDFGLARAVDDVSITQTGTVAGTPQYMSPEQALGRAVDHRSDLFALGGVLYAMCTGRAAFRAEGALAVLKRVCEDDPKPIRRTNPEIPKWLCGVVDKLLAKQADERFASADEVAELLNGYLAHLQDPETIAAPPPIAGTRMHGAGSRPGPADVERDLSMVAVILTMLGCGSLICSLIAIVGNEMMRNPSPFEVWFFLGGLLSLPVGAGMLYGAWRCHRRGSLPAVQLAVSVALVPLNPACVLGLYFTLWAARTLGRTDVAEGFDAPRPAPLRERLSWARWWTWTSRFAGVAAFLGLLSTIAGNVIDDNVTVILAPPSLIGLYAAIAWTFRRVPIAVGWGPMVLTISVVAIAFAVPFFAFARWMHGDWDEIVISMVMLYMVAVLFDSLFVAVFQAFWPLAESTNEETSPTEESTVDRNLRFVERVLRTVAAVWMTLFGLVSLVLFGVLLLDKPGPGDQFAVGLVGIAAVGTLFVGFLALHGSRHVAVRESYGWALTGCVASMLPVNPLAVLALPFTLWAFSSLTFAEARRAFNGRRNPDELSGDMAGHGNRRSHWGGSVWTDLFLLLALVLGIVVIGEVTGRTNYAESFQLYLREEGELRLADVAEGSTIVRNNGPPMQVVGAHGEYPLTLPAGRYSIEARVGRGHSTRSDVWLRAGGHVVVGIADGVQHVRIDGPRP